MNFQNSMKPFCLFLIYLLLFDYYVTCTDFVKQKTEDIFFLNSFRLMVRFFPMNKKKSFSNITDLQNYFGFSCHYFYILLSIQACIGQLGILLEKKQ